MNLDTIDWPKALHAARDGALSPRAAAELHSLAALFTGSFADAAGLLAAARATDPFNPAHPLRFILTLMRFGDWDGAADLAKSLAESTPGLALPGYLWALATMRQEEHKRAANLAQDVLNAHPKFTLAAFLRAESLTRTQLKGVRKHLADLPRGDGTAPAWADLAVKMLLSGSDDVEKVAGPLVKDAKLLPPSSRPAQLAKLVSEMTGESLEQLQQRLERIPADSRAEEIVLLQIHDRLAKLTPREAAETIRKLHDRYPERATIRRLYVSLLTRLAVAEAVEERYAEALRLVEVCLRREPHDTTHYQNRAALFTLLRETEAYHTAWFELNRHQYRLAVLGKLGPSDAARLAKPHRLFAQQARLSPSDAGGLRADAGVFAEMIRPQDVEKTKIIVPNQAKLDEDPELLRQWIHHHRAELVFSHVALGTDPNRFLLHPENRRIAIARAEGLAESAKSLSVLVPEEGQVLAERMTKHWKAAASRTVSAYDKPPEDAGVFALQSQYVETFADLAILCLRWQPDGRRPELMEEVLTLLAGVTPFFDERALAAVVKEHTGSLPYTLRVFTGYVDDLLGLDPTRERTLTEHERRRITNGLAAEMLVRQAFRTYAVYREMGNGVKRAMVFVDRARQLDPDNLTSQLTAARFFLIEGYNDDARAMIALAQKSPKAKDPDTAEEINELKKVLDERRKAKDVGKQREVVDTGADFAETPSDRVVSLEQEIERFPSAVQSYEELAGIFAAAGRFPEALEWSALAMDRCSARDAQVRARSLDLELLGLQALGERDQNMVRLYLSGVHRPPLEVLNGIGPAERSYPVWFLLGRCLLAVNQPEPARKAFESALAACDRSAHRVILRRLAGDVDHAYLLVARRTIQDKLAAGAFEEALAEAGGMMARLKRPEAGFIDLARIHAGAATARLGIDRAAMPRPSGADADAWQADLAEAYAAPTERHRARKLAELARRADAESAAKAEQLLAKLDALDEQAAIADTLARSGDLLREGKLAEALDVLDSGTDPRVIRQQALILLKLERLDEADAAIAAIRGSTTPVAREFLSAYPGLAFRQRVTIACRHIKAGSDAEAIKLLAAAQARTEEEKVELGYCRGFCRSMAGFRFRRQGRKAEARKALTEAFQEIEPLITAARAVNHTRLLELYTTLDNDPDLAHLGGLA